MLGKIIVAAAWVLTLFCAAGTVLLAMTPDTNELLVRAGVLTLSAFVLARACESLHKPKA